LTTIRRTKTTARFRTFETDGHELPEPLAANQHWGQSSEPGILNIHHCRSFGESGAGTVKKKELATSFGCTAPQNPRTMNSPL
jgi:hypothetical protein